MSEFILVGGGGSRIRGRLHETTKSGNLHMNESEPRIVIHSDPEVMGGTPVFIGTRVPLQNLIDCLQEGNSVEDFLEGFPSVTKEQVDAVIKAKLNRKH